METSRDIESNNAINTAILKFESKLWFLFAGFFYFYAYILILSASTKYFVGTSALPLVASYFGAATSWVELIVIILLSVVVTTPFLLVLKTSSSLSDVLIAELPFFIYFGWTMSCFEIDLFNFVIFTTQFIVLFTVMRYVVPRCNVRLSLLGGKANSYLYLPLVLSIFIASFFLLMVLKSTFEKGVYLSPVVALIVVFLVVFVTAKKVGGPILTFISAVCLLLFYSPFPILLSSLVEKIDTTGMCVS